MNLAHFFGEFTTLGGVQSLLRYHREHDAKQGLQSRFLIYSEEQSSSIEFVSFLGLNDRSTIREVRKRAARAILAFSPHVSIYHGHWGLSNLADLDGAPRRLLVIHGDEPGWDEAFKSRWPWLDGVLCVNELLTEKVRQLLPRSDYWRVATLHAPVCPPGGIVKVPRQACSPLRLGYSGRIASQQKRVERLPVLCRELDQLGLEYRLDLMGTGPELDLLKAEFHGNPKVQFLGYRTGLDYWHILSQWDVTIFTTDYEGGPITLLEALSVGVVPLYPDIASGYQNYPASIGADLVYPKGKMREAALRLKKLANMSSSEWIDLQSACRASIQPHVDGSYAREFATFVNRVSIATGRASSLFPSRPLFIDHCPFGWVKSAGLIRRRLLRKFTHNWANRSQGAWSGVEVGSSNS